MTYALWEVHLEDVVPYLGERGEKLVDSYADFPVHPKVMVENVAAIASLADRKQMPTIRDCYLRFHSKKKFPVDERGEQDYYAILYKWDGVGRGPSIVPERFSSEDQLVDELANHIDSMVILGSYASRCLLKRAKGISHRFNLIVPQDAIFDRNKPDYDFSLKSLQRMDAKIVSTSELVKMLNDA
jgi:hypothetical protein